MLKHNSLLRIKEGICIICGDKKPIYAKKTCQTCYQNQAKARYAKKYAEDNIEDDESVAILKKDADLLFSRLIRLRAAEPETGICRCFICGNAILYSKAHAMHFEGRIDSSVRYSFKNVRVGDEKCNIYLNGNLYEYARKLEEEEKGLPEFLKLEGKEVYKFTRDELKRMIADWTVEINHLKKIKNLK